MAARRASLQCWHENKGVIMTKPRGIPPNPAAVAAARQAIDALGPNFPWQIVAGGIDNEGRAFFKLRQKRRYSLIKQLSAMTKKGGNDKKP
jgi:hypothetical protein